MLKKDYFGSAFRIVNEFQITNSKKVFLEIGIFVPRDPDGDPCFQKIPLQGFLQTTFESGKLSNSDTYGINRTHFKNITSSLLDTRASRYILKAVPSIASTNCPIFFP